jgi:hypothetical protein
MASDHEKPNHSWLHDLNEGDVFLSQPKAKVAKKEKHECQIVEYSFHVNTIPTNYHQHFTLYFRDKKQVAQLIASLMCKFDV